MFTKNHVLSFVLILLFCLFGINTRLFAEPQEPNEQADLFEMSLEELMEVPITLASYGPKTIREQPGIVTVITRRDIENSGARDLIDIINLVPGFRTVSEVHETISLGARGIYAAEGKILLLVDGIEMNENLFGYFILGEHYPADMIERVEIIRGPGSAMYGGSAEMAVIKITTRGQDTSETVLSSTLSFNSGHAAYRNSVLNSHNEDKWGYSIFASGFRGNRSNETYSTLYPGGEWGYPFYDMAEESSLFSEFYNVGLRYGKLKLRAIHDDYEYDYKDWYGWFWGRRRHVFDTTAYSGEYEIGLSDRLTVTPKVTYRQHVPWSYKYSHIGVEREVIGKRLTYNILSKYEVDEKSLLSFGAEYYEDMGIAHQSHTNGGSPWPSYDDTTYFNGNRRISYYNQAYFAQYEFPMSIGDICLGGRYEHHNYAGESLVPRLAITKVFDKFHYKLLYANAFRTPNIENINFASWSSEILKPERTTTYEVETGYKFTKSLLWTINAFHLTIEDPIFYDYGGGSLYVNGKPVASYGLESELRYTPSWGDMKIRYGWYQTDRAGVPPWRTDDRHQAAAFPNHQLSLDLTYNLSENSSINLNGFITSDFEGYKISDGLPTEHFDGEPIFNIYYLKQLGNMKVGLGVSDILDERETISSYDSYQAPIPQMGRTFYVTCSLKF